MLLPLIRPRLGQVVSALVRAGGKPGGGGGGLTAPVNTVAPAATGATPAGSLLSCTTGTWSGNPTPTYAYQWRSNGVDIGGATASTYTTLVGQVGTSITCRVTATNSQGSASQVSNGITVTAAAPAAAVIQVSAAPLHQNGSATVYNQVNALTNTPQPNSSLVMPMSCHDNGVGARPTSVRIGGVLAVHVAAAEHDTASTRETLWYVQDCGPTPTKDVQINYATATDRYQTFGVIECTPLAPSPVDQARGVYWYDDAPGWPQVITTPGPTTQASELAIAMTICGSGQPDINITSPASPGWSNLFKEIDSSTYQGGQASYKVLTAIETPSASWNSTGPTANHWSTIIATFKFA